MVRATKLELQKMHDVLKRHGAKYDKDKKIIKGSYRRGAIKAAAEALGKDRRTMYNWLDKYPSRPEREPRKKPVIPKYVADFNDSETVKDYIAKRVGKTHNAEYVSIGLIAWKILGKKKDPISWTEEDYRILWDHPDFRDEMMGTISFHRAVALRSWMKHCGRRDLWDEFPTDELKRPKGAKKTEWLKNTEELNGVINGIQYPDTLMMFFIGIQCGSRFGSIRRTNKSHISYVTNQIYMFEPKTKDYVERDFSTESLETLRKYIYDFEFEGKQRIFPRSLKVINDDLKQAGVKAGIPFSLTTHVAMKHTFVSLASNRGVSLEVVSQQTGTDPTTLKDFYAGLDRRKIRHELIGEKYEEPTYHEVIKAINQSVRKRYAQIKEHLIAVNGIERDGRRKKEPKPKRIGPRPINWKAIEAMVASEKTPEALRKYHEKRLKMHRQGLSDDEIRKRMKKSA